MRKAFLLLLVASLSAAGCSSKNPMSPTQSARGAGVQTFVLQSPADPRLPAPMLEATGATAADWAGLRAPTAAAREARAARSAADPASFWSDLATQLGQRAALPEPLFARAHALTSIAIFDALAASEDPRRGSLPANAVAAGAASVVLGHLFPGDVAAINDEASAQAGIRSQFAEGARGRAWALGRKVGRIVVERARTDGSSAVYRGAIPTGAAKWTGARPQFPLAGAWKSWLFESGATYTPEAPYRAGSPADLREVEEVVRFAQSRTPEQTAAVHRWSDGPAGAMWDVILAARVHAVGAGALASARAFAYLDAAVYDAQVSSWQTKYAYWTARPSQRRAGLATAIPNPSYPAYPSEVATLSAAAAEVMSELFPRERDTFEAQADEAAKSGLWGGLQFRHDIEQGLILGRSIGEKAAARMQGDDVEALAATR